MLSCPFRIRVNGIPPTGTKSRVETQIKLSIQLVPIDKAIVPSIPWKYLRVPEYLLARPKLKKIAQKQKLMNVEDPSNILDLEARVICESNKHKKIKMCQGCVRREVMICRHCFTQKKKGLNGFPGRENEPSVKRMRS